jgi:predicted RNase H-like HicB family nuclease
MNNYLIIIEKTSTGFSAYSPDVEGCVAVGETEQEVEMNMREALEFHLEFLKEKGYEIPKPGASIARYLEVKVA